MRRCDLRDFLWLLLSPVIVLLLVLAVPYFGEAGQGGAGRGWGGVVCKVVVLAAGSD